MKKLFLITISLVALSILIGCASEAEKKEKRKEKITKSIQKDNGKILLETKDLIYYVTKDGLFCIDYDNPKPSPVQFYTNLDSINIVRYEVDLNPSNAEVKKTVIPIAEFRDSQFSNNDIKKFFNFGYKGNIYKLSYPWIIIGREFVAHVSDPYSLIDISHLENDKNLLQSFNSLSSVPLTKDKGNFSFYEKFSDKDSINYSTLLINLTNDTLKIKDLPGFLEYKAKNIPQVLWSGKWFYKDLVADYNTYNIASPTEINDLLTYQYTVETYPSYSIKFDADNNEFKEEKIKWGDTSITFDEWNAHDFNKLFNSRDLTIKYAWDNFKNRASSKVTAAKLEREKALQEQREKEEKAREEARKREIERINKEAIDIEDIIAIYKRNEFKGEELYPKGKYFYIRTKLFSLSSGSKMFEDNWRYGIEGDSDSLTESWIYSNDDYFRKLEYPTKNPVIIRARFGGFEYRHPVFYGATLEAW